MSPPDLTKERSDEYLNTKKQWAQVNALTLDVDPDEKEKVTAPQTTPPDFPDGGLRAWLIVVGAFFCGIATFGFVNAWGAFQSYYEEVLLKDYSPSTIAWIGSVQYSLVFFPALPIGRLFDLGTFRLPFLISSVLVVVASFLTAECKEYWQLILCQGLLQGAACGCAFGPMLALIGQWFRKRRGLAMGLVACGSSVGGTVFPIATRRLIVQVGFPWAMRILGFILLFCLAISNLTLARRLPPKHADGGMLNLSAFKFAPFTIWSLAAFINFLGLYTALTYIDISAVRAGISQDFSFYLVAIANASSGLGRVTAGFVADKIGPINFMAPTTLIAGVSSFMMPLFEMGEMHDIGRRCGMVLSIGAIGALVGPPISGAINHKTGGFEAVGWLDDTSGCDIDACYKAFDDSEVMGKVLIRVHES
ncbi:monocarboxylate permease [Moniliophthora roreri]|nr:monocarboxylate permease [Moniliophthora roreri]